MTSFHSNDRNRFRPTVEEHANERCCNEAAQLPEVGLGSGRDMSHHSTLVSIRVDSRPLQPGRRCLEFGPALPNTAQCENHRFPVEQFHARIAPNNAMKLSE